MTKCMKCDKKVDGDDNYNNLSYRHSLNDEDYLILCLDCWKDWQLWLFNMWKNWKLNYIFGVNNTEAKEKHCELCGKNHDAIIHTQCKEVQKENETPHNHSCHFFAWHSYKFDKISL